LSIVVDWARALSVRAVVLDGDTMASPDEAAAFLDGALAAGHEA